MDLTGRVRRWNRGGFIILFFVGTLWHFLFNLSGHFPLVGAFAPVNREHLGARKNFVMAHHPLVVVGHGADPAHARRLAPG